MDLGDFNGNTSYAHYEYFSVVGTSDNYRLFVSGYSGTAADAMTYHSGYQFTTRDRDNDAWSSITVQYLAKVPGGITNVIFPT